RGAGPPLRTAVRRSALGAGRLGPGRDLVDRVGRLRLAEAHGAHDTTDDTAEGHDHHAGPEAQRLGHHHERAGDGETDDGDGDTGPGGRGVSVAAARHDLLLVAVYVS